MDDKVNNVVISGFSFLPFVDNAIWWSVDSLSGTKSISRGLIQDVLTSLGSTIGAGSNVHGLLGGTSKLAKAAGHISSLISGGNVLYEAFSSNSYINQITASIFDGHYNALSFDWTARYFVAYAAITQDMIKQGIITYEKDRGRAVWINYDQAAFNRYFEDLGITVSDVSKMVRGGGS